MRTWFTLLFLALALGCPGEPGRGSFDERPLSYDVILAPAQIVAPLGGLMWGITAKVNRQPDGAPVDLRTWATWPSTPGQFKWEILDVPPGGDGGRFSSRASGTLLEAMNESLIGWPNGQFLLQGYYPPGSLPSGTTRLELKIRITIMPPDGSPAAQAQIPLTLDVTAPGLAPSKGETD